MDHDLVHAKHSRTTNMSSNAFAEAVLSGDAEGACLSDSDGLHMCPRTRVVLGNTSIIYFLDACFVKTIARIESRTVPLRSL
jgi:hypothetical protein